MRNLLATTSVAVLSCGAANAASLDLIGKTVEFRPLITPTTSGFNPEFTLDQVKQDPGVLIDFGANLTETRVVVDDPSAPEFSFTLSPPSMGAHAPTPQDLDVRFDLDIEAHGFSVTYGTTDPNGTAAPNLDSFFGFSLSLLDDMANVVPIFAALSLDEQRTTLADFDETQSFARGGVAFYNQDGVGTFQDGSVVAVTLAPVPVPAAAPLAAIGFGLLALAGRRGRRAV